MINAGETSVFEISSVETDISITQTIFENAAYQLPGLRKSKMLPVLGIALAVSITSPATAIQDHWTANHDTSGIISIINEPLTVGRRISRAEALALCQKIMEDAEQRRLEAAIRDTEIYSYLEDCL
jgi:hypothetical protein